MTQVEPVANAVRVLMVDSAGTAASGTGDASAAKQDTGNTSLAAINTNAGALADAVDLAGGATSMASKLRGLVQLAASILAKLPSLGTAGTPSTNVISVQGVASGTAQPASQSGTWTVQPGNTANTTAWKVDGSAVTQPVSLNGGLPAALAAGGGLKVEGVAGGVAQSVTAGGYTVRSSATITRPGDTTAYAAKDAISSSTSAPAILTFASCARTSGGSGYVTGARLVTNQAANVSAYRLHLYDATLSAVNDNAAQTVLETNWASYLGYIDLPAAGTDGSDSAISQSTQAPLPFVAAGTSLFGMLETITGFTPANAQHFRIDLGIEQN